MTWLNPITQAEWSLLDLTTTISKWPVPNVRRIAGPFWFATTGFTFSPMPSRYITRFRYRAGENVFLTTALDMSGVSSGVIEARTGENDDGQELFLRCTDFRAPHPEFGMLGVEWLFTYERKGFADKVTVTFFFGLLEPGVSFVPYFLDHAEPGAGREPPSFWRTNWTPELDTDWTNPRPDIAALWIAVPQRRQIPNN